MFLPFPTRSSSDLGLFAVMLIFFTYFYVAITFNPEEVADNMKRYGGFIPGVRAGRPTADHLDYVITRITAPGSLYLAFGAPLPTPVLARLDITGPPSG